MSNIVKELRVNARYDLQSSYVLIRYEQTQNVDGLSWMVPTTDQYPDPAPVEPLKNFNALRFTVDLQGTQATTTTARLACDAISLGDPAWWLARHPQYTAHDGQSAAEDNIPIATFAIDFSTVKRAPTNAGETDLGYTNELRTGQLAAWMNFKSQRITVSCRANITLRNGHVIQDHPVTYQLLATNAVTGDYQNQQVSAYAEPEPVGLSQQLYEAVSVLQYEGEVTLQEAEAGGRVGVGNLVNLTGGALPEWAAMNALVQRVTEDLDAGTTTVEFGPPKNLSAGELVDLLRVNRNRLIHYNVGLAIAGTGGSGGGEVALGSNTPEKNSSSTAGYTRAHVVSGTIDGTGAVVTTLPSLTQWTPSGPYDPDAPYPSGSVTIALGDAAGNTLRIQPIPICQNGVRGKVWFLCSDFIADA